MHRIAGWRSYFRGCFAIWLSLLLGRAAAQCTVSAPPAGCPVPFVAVDVATGQEVQALCVGRAVRFQPACGRVVAPNLLYYNALPGQNITPPNCDFVPGQLANNTFTPAAAGALTVSELTNPAVAGGTGTVYVRNFQVLASPPPIITVLPCARNSASLLIQSSGYDSYFAQVNNGPPIGPLGIGRTTLPAAAGSTITVVGRYNGNALCGGQSTATVPALTIGPLAIPTLTATGGTLPGPVSFTFQGLSATLSSSLQVADPASPTRFRGVVGFLNPTNFTQSQAAPGLYRLANYDACGLDSTFSEPVPAVPLAGASTNNVNTLTWPAFGPVAGYVLLRDGQPLATLPPGTSTYVDAAVSCGTTYRYRLRTTTPGGSMALSNEVAVTTRSTQAPPAPLLVAGFNLQNQVQLAAFGPGGAALPAGGQVQFRRLGGPADLTFAAVPTAPGTLRDSLVTLAQLLARPPCYTAQTQDVCGNLSPVSLAVCPTLLQAEAADPDGLTAQLSWTAFRGPAGAGAAASYRVLRLAPDGTVLSASAPTPALTFLDANPPADRQLLRYRVEASGAGLPPSTISYSNVATVARRVLLVVPTAFTPNGDGLNDVLELKGRYLNGFAFVIIDRNGQEVFRATDRSQTWDGRVQGHAPVPGPYVWRLTLQDETGQPFTQTGTVTILK